MPSRRALLAASTGTLALFAGCADTLGSVAPTADPASADDLASYDCPPHGTSRERAVCSQTVDPESASVYLLPSRPVADSAAAIDLTLHNDSDTDLGFNPHTWMIHVERTTGWVEIEQQSQGNGALTVAPGETHTWTFEGAVRKINETVPLDSGTYTAEIGVPDPDGDDWLSCLALVSLR
ncbi:hypothetical protein [Halomarina rubra]|uniref:Intracellular proteinase inhibitor BsuPI domain-containing protein n=1 Tax=Halomarina rubra TaxID=2071873 RepID=A0ABD6AXA2_9EURY|nr:hypothetical protein [Halomarina rubra]